MGFSLLYKKSPFRYSRAVQALLQGRKGDFTAFAINVKTIALGKYLYQSGYAIWCERTELVTPSTRFICPDQITYIWAGAG